MPVYHKLRITNSHTPAAQARNRRIASNLLRLRNKLREHFQAEQSRRDGVQEDRITDSTRLLRLATWNIREFDFNNYGKRLEGSLYYIAEIIAQFDLIALQEVREGWEALDMVMEILGPGWRYIATDVTEGEKGNRERMVFAYNAYKVFFADLAGEVVLPKDKVDDTVLFKKGARLELPGEGQELLLPEDIPTYHRQGIEKLNQEVCSKLPEQTKLVLPPGSALILPKRTIVSRTAGEQPAFPLDNDLKDVIIKLPRRAAISESLNYARTPYLVRNGFEVPEQLQSLPGSNVKQDKYYDQIAYLSDPSNRPADSVTPVEVQRAGVFDFFETLFRHGETAGSTPVDIGIYQARSNSLREAIAKAKASKQKRKKAALTAAEELAVAEKVYLDWRTYKMSDHLPM